MSEDNQSTWANKIVGYGTEKADQLLAHEGNWRIHPKYQQDALTGVLDEVGWVQNVIVNKRTSEEWGKDRFVETIVDGHLRVALAISKGDSVPITYVDLTPSEERLVLLTIDPISALAATDKEQLDALLRDVNTGDAAVMEMLSQLATDNGIVPPDFEKTDPKANKGALAERFTIPPFSVWDTRQGYWVDRRAKWDAFMGDVAVTREDTLGGGALKSITAHDDKYAKSSFASNVSELDPVLCEISYQWFTPQTPARILNPFGGEPVSAIVAAFMGYHYTGIELRKEQLGETVKKASQLDLLNNVDMRMGDATESAEILKDCEPFDLLFSSPPYYDLEVYSDNPSDLSQLPTYEQFMAMFAVAFKGAVSKLNDNRFAVINVTEIRDKRGVYRQFVPDTIRVFTDMGMHFYNDIVLINHAGTAGIRAAGNMRQRKVVRTHQNVLVFYKGNPAKVNQYYSELAEVFDFERLGETV